MGKHGIISMDFKAFAGVDTMDEFIKKLDPNLDYLEHKIIGNETKVCIDDFAFRKRKTYGTIMVDIDTHRIIDLLAANFILPTEASHYDGKPAGDYWDKPVKEDAPAAEHNANVKKKMETVEQVRELGNSINSIFVTFVVGRLVLMTAALIFSMAYQVTGERLHEWVGIFIIAHKGNIPLTPFCSKIHKLLCLLFLILFTTCSIPQHIKLCRFFSKIQMQKGRTVKKKKSGYPHKKRSLAFFQQTLSCLQKI